VIILALETATEACSAALLVDGAIRERFEVAPRGHSQLILPMVEDLLAEAAISLGRVDALAFGRGPGAFTGVRIAVGVAQGIAFGADLPVVPVSTLAALAQGVDAAKVLVAMDARMNEVYWGAYERNPEGLMVVSGEECVAPPQAVPLPATADWFGAGSGWGAYESALADHCGRWLRGWDASALPHAGAVAQLGAAGLATGQTVAAEQALPVYLRDQVAWQKTP
jgi:tRNA threonylcarbamoyladenosine biosynthesis protein TsaB